MKVSNNIIPLQKARRGQYKWIASCSALCPRIFWYKPLKLLINFGVKYKETDKKEFINSESLQRLKKKYSIAKKNNLNTKTRVFRLKALN